jgi:hypothetical protein
VAWTHGLILAGFLLYDFVIDRALAKREAAEVTIDVVGH